MNEAAAAIRVVVADDDPDIRDLVMIAARRAGLTVVAALGDGSEAWESIRTEKPDFAVLDVSMPGLTGVQITRLVRADPEVSGMRIMLLTAAVDDKSRQAGLDAGASEYFIKPFSPRELAARLAEIAALSEVGE